MHHPPDYLVIGHICRDISPTGYRPGGTAAYAAHMAHQLGCHTAVLTSTSPSYNLSEALPLGVDIHSVPALHDTVFENTERNGSRQQTIHSVASRITAAQVPAHWFGAAVVHLAPIANELDPTLINQFRNHIIGVTPQGWMRGWGDNGRVYPRPLPEAEEICRKATAVILSEEDVSDEALLKQFIQWANMLVLTRGAKGCTLFHHGRTHDIAAPAVAQVDATGAGDIFAAAFLIRLWRNSGDPFEAARFATQRASHSVTQVGLVEKVKGNEQ